MDSPRTSITLERSVLGAALVYPQVLTALRSVLAPEHFADATHALLWKHIGLLDTAGIVPDALTLAEELTAAKRGQARCPTAIEIEGFRAYAPSSPEAAEGIARKVAGLSHGRRVLHAAQAVERLALDPSVSLTDLCTQAPKLMMEATTRLEEREGATAIDLATECWTNLERWQREGRPVGLSTGLEAVDDYARLSPGQLWIAAGRPAMGKSAFAGRLARAIAEQGKPVLFFSLEMSREDIFLRLACEIAEVDSRAAESGQLDQRSVNALTVAIERLSKLPLEIHDQGGISLFDLRTRTQRAHARYGQLGLVVVDYLQLMRGSRGKNDSREQEVSEISRGGKELAKELGTTVLMLSQLSRKCEERADKRPMLSDLRESGSIEQDADVVLMLYRDDYYNQQSAEPGVAEVNVAKQRKGPTGTAKLAFDRRYTRFSTLEQAQVVQMPRKQDGARPRRARGSYAPDARAGGDAE